MMLGPERGMTTDRGRGGISMVFQSVINHIREFSDANPDQKTHAGCYRSRVPVRLGSSCVCADRRQRTRGTGREGSEAKARKAAQAQRKAEHKAARAKNNAELKKLEDAGYKPAANDPNYPQNLQNAEKKAAGASQ